MALRVSTGKFLQIALPFTKMPSAISSQAAQHNINALLTSKKILNCLPDYHTDAALLPATRALHGRIPGFSVIGKLISRTGRSSSFGVAGRSRPSVSSSPCSAAALIHTFSSVLM